MNCLGRKSVEKEVSEVQVTKVLNYLQERNVHVHKADERPWGTYHPAMSWDGSFFVVLPKAFGYGFEPMYACAYALTEHILHNTFNNDFNFWMGLDRHKELKELLENDIKPKLLGSGDN